MLCRRRFQGVLFAALVAVFGACGNSSTSDASGAAKSAGSAAALAKRIVPANTAAAEYVLDLVVDERIAALPEQMAAYSDQLAKHSGLVNLPRFARYAAEPVLALRPDFVVTHTWQASDTSAVLERAGIRVFVLESVLEYADLRANLTRLGDALDVRARADSLVSELDRRVQILDSKSKKRAGKRALVYSNSGAGGTVAARGTTADGLLHMVGLVNAAASLKGHVPIDFEKVLELAPDLFIVSRPAHGESGSPTKVVLETTPALASLRAIREHRIVVLTSAELSTDSPTLVNAAEAMAEAVDRAFDL